MANSILNLSRLNGSNGFILNGIDGFDYSGRAVSSAGDVNGDGLDDLLIGAQLGNPNGNNSGESYVVFGRSSGFGSSLNLSSLNGSNGFVLNGIDAGDYSGRSVSGVGDVNGDGHDDLIIGADGADPNGQSSGESYVVFGRSSGFGSSLNLSSLNSSTGFVLNGIDAYDGSGRSVSSAGDVNGDGLNDLIIGADGADPNGNFSGESYVVFGRRSGVSSTLNLASLNGSNGFVLNGIAAGDRSGISVSSAGDVNGDGISDVIIGAAYASANGQVGAGQSYVVFGRSSGFSSQLNLSSLSSTTGFVINGVNAGDNSGVSVSDAGDVNGDGIGDIIIGAGRADVNGRTDAGKSYVVFGRTTSFGRSLNLSSLNGRTGFVLNGEESNDLSGLSVSSAGDVNGDGFGDLIIGADGAPNGSRVGKSYVVFGRSSGFSAQLNLSSLNGNTGFVINGVDEPDASGRAVSNAGDVDGDGIDDLIIGAFRADQNSDYNRDAGESYVVFGNKAPELDLNSAKGKVSGFVINGVDESDRSGYSVSNAGDVNGDGIDDLIIGAEQASPNGQIFAGKSYVVFGRTSGFGASLNLSSLNGSNGFVLNGIDAFDRSGSSVSNAGDVNGDGIDDLIIGARGASPNGVDSGESYVVFGRSSGFGSSLNLSSLNGNTGFVLNGIDTGDASGRSVSSAGDVNGDGIDDLIIGARGASPNGFASVESYVVFGRSSGFGSSLNLASLNGNTGFVIQGIDRGDYSDSSVSNAGDVNGDGIDDLIIGANGADPIGQDSGESYVVFGRSSGFGSSLNLTSLNGSTGFVIQGILGGDNFGASVSGAGDVNGDGLDDLIIGARGASPIGSYGGEGQSYVVFGRSNGFASFVDLSSLDGSTGFVINGIDGFDNSGVSVSSAGDVNGDGLDDLLIGANVAGTYDEADRGESYVVFGRSNGFASSLNLSSLNGSNGFVLNGIDAYDNSSASVSSAGDVNGDGFDDLLIAADNADPNGQFGAGESYVVFGSKTIGAGGSIELSALGGSGSTGLNFEATFNGTFVRIVDTDVSLGDANSPMLTGATIRITNPLGGAEVLVTNLVGTSITSSYNPGTATLTLTGNDTVANYRTVLRRVAYNNTAANPIANIDRTIEFIVDDGESHSNTSAVATTTVSFGNVSITGTANPDTLTGSDGNNSISGLGGNDILEGGLGADILAGGEGLDTASYGNSNAGVNVNLTTNLIMGGHAQGDSLSSIEFLRGSAFNDTLTGDTTNNQLRGFAGNDILTGGDGIDFLFGGVGRDLLRGGLGSDRFVLSSLGESVRVASAFDGILDLAIGTDIVDGPTAMTAANVAELGPAANLTVAGIQAILTTANFGANRGATFNVASRTYLALNDGIAGYAAETDALIDITGFTGNLADLAIA